MSSAQRAVPHYWWLAVRFEPSLRIVSSHACISGRKLHLHGRWKCRDGRRALPQIPVFFPASELQTILTPTDLLPPNAVRQRCKRFGWRLDAGPGRPNLYRQSALGDGCHTLPIDEVMLSYPNWCFRPDIATWKRRLPPPLRDFLHGRTRFQETHGREREMWSKGGVTTRTKEYGSTRRAANGRDA